jgi:predicted dehydrogenase
LNEVKREMKICVIGLGSMGKRRIRHLLALGVATVVGVDVNPERRAEAVRVFDIDVSADAGEAIAAMDYDAVVISTPPDLHAVHGNLAAHAGKPFFMEANVVREGLPELAAFCKTRRIMAASSCSMRFHPSVKLLKRVVDQVSPRQIAAFSYVCGQYLPDWHPYEDYRRFYVARRETGACREIVPFELTWLNWLFGEVTAVCGVKAKRTGLEIDGDDIYMLNLTFDSGVVGSLEVNVISRIPERHFRAIGERLHIIWNWADQEVKVYDATAEAWKIYSETSGFAKFNLEDIYYEEMKTFIQAVRGETEYGYGLAEELKILETLYRAEQMTGETANV